MPILNKAGLIEHLAEETGQTKAQAERFLLAFQDKVIDAVANGEDVKLTGFASFEPVTRAARTMRNPRTGDSLEVPETKSVRIRPLKRFKDAIGGENEE